MDKKIYDLRFNSDNSCFTCAMESGVRVYNVEPLIELRNYDVETIGSVKMCGLVDRSSALWMVCGGGSPKYPEDHVLIFNLAIGQFEKKFTFPQNITAVCMKLNKIVISSETEIYMWSYGEIKELWNADVKDNSIGILELTPSLTCDREIVLYPGVRSGSLQIVDITNIEAAHSSTPVLLECHNNVLACIKLNFEGTRLATASVKGTIIRVWDTVTYTKLFELRRGCEPARIYCLSFNKTSEYLCCTSDKGTGHIFTIRTAKPRTLVFKQLLESFGNKSFATFQFPPQNACVTGFGPYGLNVVGLDGTYDRYMFSLRGNCDRDKHDIYLNVVGSDKMRR